MGKLIVIEGSCDGVGKSTQYKLLIDRLINEKSMILLHITFLVMEHIKVDRLKNILKVILVIIQNYHLTL